MDFFFFEFCKFAPEFKFHDLSFAKGFDPFSLSLNSHSSRVKAVHIGFIQFLSFFDISSDCHLLGPFLLEKSLKITKPESESSSKFVRLDLTPMDHDPKCIFGNF